MKAKLSEYATKIFANGIREKLAERALARAAKNGGVIDDILDDILDIGDDIVDDWYGDTVGEGAGNTKLYRVMSDAEYESIIKNGGKFNNYDYAMEEKWFATSAEHGVKWGEIFYPDGKYKMIEIEVPANSLDKLYYVHKLDGIGPAYSGEIDFLNSIMKGLNLQ